MLRRLYIHNYKCLVAFELKLDKFHVFCGENGSGKSSVLDALWLVRRLALGACTLEDPECRRLAFCRWLDSDKQVFELEFIRQNKIYLYKLEIQQANAKVLPRIVHEKALCDGQVLFVRDLENVQLPRPDGAFSGFPLDWRQAALGAIHPTPNRTELENLQKAMVDLLIVRPDPFAILPESERGTTTPDFTLKNFISWFRELSSAQEFTDVLRERLKYIWPDFRSLKLETTGLETKALLLKFQMPESEKSLHLWFHEFSEGEKMLFVLYTLQCALDLSKQGSLFIDEPDNFVGLPELQPWLNSMLETVNQHKQVIVVSHNPEILNMTGRETALYFTREDHLSPAKVTTLNIPQELTPAEAVLRGWVVGT